MTTDTTSRRALHPRLALVLATALLLALGLAAPASEAATPLTVGQALSRQDGSSQTVRGYVVGQPTATNTVIRSGFPNDYALAIADTAGETSTSAMLYVQVPSAFRSGWGLRSNPGLVDRQIDLTGNLTAYFSHPGAKNATTFAPAGSGGGTGGGGTGGDGPWDATYYAPAIGLSGTALKAELHDIIDEQTALTYAQVWTALKDTDEDPSNTNNIRTLYSGLSLPKSTNGGGVDDWNREHTWAKSHGDFGTATGPGTDIHHLRPEDVTVNGARGNKDFDEGGGTVSQCSGCATDADSFEPRDAVKGDVARMIFYMAVRYEGDDGWADLELDDVVGNGSAPLMGRVSVLLAWNAQDPVDAFEARRNDRIHSTWQHNRNPFVDHPEWAASIWG